MESETAFLGVERDSQIAENPKPFVGDLQELLKVGAYRTISST
jgi:hypothetical protein